MLKSKLKIYVTDLDSEIEFPKFTKCGYTESFIQSFELYGGVSFVDFKSADVIILLVTFLDNNYKFNYKLCELISKSNKPIVLIDYTEYGGSNQSIRLKEYNLYGYKLEFEDLNTYSNSNFLHNFLLDNKKNICCYFKRELSSYIDYSIVPFKVYPIEFVSESYTENITHFISKDEYYKRKCIYNFIYGFSNYSRSKLHGSFLMNHENFDSIFATSYKQYLHLIENTNECFILICNTEWHERVPLDDINRNTLMSIDLYGCGQKCFRNVESTKNCLSVKQDPNHLIHSYKWIHDYNCIVLPTNEDLSIDIDKSIDILLQYRHYKRDLLYDMYLNSLEMNRLYSLKNYIPNKIINNIRKNI
jgi:hypothetical protein